MIAFVLLKFPPLDIRSIASLKRYGQAKILEATETRETPSSARHHTEIGRNYRRDFIALFKNKLLALLTTVTVAQLYFSPIGIGHNLHTVESIVLEKKLAQFISCPVLKDIEER